MTVRAAHVLPATHPAGAEHQALNLLRGLLGHGVAPELAYFERGSLHPQFEGLGIPLHDLGRQRRFALDARRRTLALRAVYERRPPEILQTWLFEASAVGAWAARAWPGTRVVLAQRSGTAERGRTAQMWATRLLLRRADYAVANSEDGADLLRDLGFDADRIRVIPQGVAPERATARRDPAAVRADLGVGPGDRLIVTVGRADPTKDLGGLFRALAPLRAERADIHLALVGPAPGDLDALGLGAPDGVAALGWQDCPADYMRAADVVVVPSWTEGHSNVAGEALLLGCPVVATDTGAHVPIVSACGGRVVPVRDPEALAGAVRDLLERPPARAEVIRCAQPRLSNDRVVEAVLEVYDQVLAGSPRRGDP